MNDINEKDFALVCYNILMDEYDTKAITYMREKVSMLDNGWNAFGALDVYNMKKVIDYCEKWKWDLPDQITRRYKNERRAADELGL